MNQISEYREIITISKENLKENLALPLIQIWRLLPKGPYRSRISSAVSRWSTSDLK
jgi:hypothetical protein